MREAQEGGKRTAPAIRATPVVRIEDAYLSLRHLSLYSDLSIRTLRGYLTHPGRPLPHYRIGGKIVVRRSEFDDWAAGFKVALRASLNETVRDILSGLRVG